MPRGFYSADYDAEMIRLHLMKILKGKSPHYKENFVIRAFLFLWSKRKRRVSRLSMNERIL